MRKPISILVAFCLLLAVVPTLIPSAHAAGANGAENSLQFCYYYDINEACIIADSWTSAILFQLDGTNFILTNHAPRENMYTIFTIANDSESFYVAEGGESLGGGIYVYLANPDFGKAEGFYPVGAVSKGEEVAVIFWGDSGYSAAYGAATDYTNGNIIIEGVTGSVPYFLPVLNSRNELCAIYSDDGLATPLIIDEASFNGNQPDSTEPPTTKPDATKPSQTPSQEEQRPQAIKIPMELPSLEELHKHAITQKASSNTGTILIVICAVLAVALLTAVVIVKSRTKATDNSSDSLDEAEEGTQLATEPESANLWLLHQNGRRIPLSHNITIGRAPSNSVVIPNVSTCVSGRHCEILVQSGVAYLRDLGSTNGTFINGHRLTPGQPVQLHLGIKIVLGGVNSPEVFLVTNNNQM